MTTINGFEEFAGMLDDFAEDLEEIADGLDQAIDEGTRETALQVEATAMKNAPVRDGELRADISTLPIELGVYSVGTDKEYAPSVEYGSRPHPITPNGPYPLRFQIDGEWIATHQVDHPGTEPQPFLRPALNRHRSELVQNIHEKIEELINSEL